MRQTKRFLVEETGSALVYTLMVLTVLSILGLSIMAVTLGSYRLGRSNQETTSVYYIAESGANLAYAEVYQKIPELYEEQTKTTFFSAVDNFLKDEKKYDQFASQAGIKPQATVTIDTTKEQEGTTKTYLIRSEGEIGNKKRVVEKEFTVSWKSKGLPLDTVLVTRGKTVFINGDIKSEKEGIVEGRIYIDSNDTPSIYIAKKVNGENVGWPTFKDVSLHYVENESSNNSKLTYNNEYKENLPPRKELLEEIPWDEIESYTENTTINLFKLLPKKIEGIENAIVDSKGNFEVIAGGLNNYELNVADTNEGIVEGEKVISIPKFNIGGGYTVTINTNDQNTILQINEFIMGSAHIIVTGTGNLTIRANEISMSADSSIKKLEEKQSVVLAYSGEKDLYLKGHGKTNVLLLAPKAKVVMTESHTLTGMVAANEFEMLGGSNLLYDKSATFNGSASTAPDSLLQAGPTLEK